MLLKDAKSREMEVNGTYDEKTRRAIKKIRASRDLPVDGLVGDATKIVLYRIAGLSGKPE